MTSKLPRISACSDKFHVLTVLPHLHILNTPFFTRDVLLELRNLAEAICMTKAPNVKSMNKYTKAKRYTNDKNYAKVRKYANVRKYTNTKKYTNGKKEYANVKKYTNVKSYSNVKKYAIDKKYAKLKKYSIRM